MKLQKLLIVFAAMVAIVAVEGALLRHFTHQEKEIVPVATAEPVSTDVPVATQVPAANTVRTAAPGYTSPPAAGVAAPANTPAANNNTGTTATTPPASTPVVTQVPTPAPTEPPPSGTVVSSNNFSSNTGTGLNMNIGWQATDLGDGTTRITINGTVNSYTLQVMGLPVEISFAGQSKTVTGNAISVDSTRLVSSSLFSTSMDVPSGTSGTMTVSWTFNGTYNDVSLGTITASDTVYS